MHIEQTGCEGVECTVERALPFAGPLLAFIGILAVALATVVPMMMG